MITLNASHVRKRSAPRLTWDRDHWVFLAVCLMAAVLIHL